MKGIHENSPALHIELSLRQRWIRCCPRAYRTFREFEGRIPFAALNCWFSTQARYTYEAWNTLMFVELQMRLECRSDPALTLCMTFKWERWGTPRFVPTCYWLHDPPISHYFRANSPHIEYRTHPWRLTCVQKLRPESQPPSIHKSKAELEVCWLWVGTIFEVHSWILLEN